MDRFKHKITDESGETLIEALVAILVCTLAIVMLIGATMAAMKINEKAMTLDTQLQNEQMAAESWQSDYAGGLAIVTITDATSSDAYQVTFYGEDGELTSYKWTGVVDGNVVQAQ